MATEPERWRASDAEAAEAANRRINTYALVSDAAGIVSWQCPDGYTYRLDPSTASPNTWHTVFDVTGKPVVAFRRASNQDGEVVVSLEGSNSIAATLLHAEDDRPSKFYYATDGGNQNPLGRWAFILRAEGDTGCPLGSNRGLRVMTVRDTP